MRDFVNQDLYVKRETRVFLALCREEALTILEFVNEILNDNLKNYVNLVRNKQIIVKSQIGIQSLKVSEIAQPA